MLEPFNDALAAQGIKYALSEDACAAMLRIASDPTINGRALAILPRENCPEGYMDLAQDDMPLSTIVGVEQNASVLANHAKTEHFALSFLRSIGGLGEVRICWLTSLPHRFLPRRRKLSGILLWCGRESFTNGMVSCNLRRMATATV